MSDEIRITSIELENYRQYYGKHKIVLSDRDEGFTVIFGRNGDGKSNLLNAITWCLYHKEPHGVGDDADNTANRRLPVINTRYVNEMKEGSMGNTRVKIWLQKGDTTYSISRVLDILKHKLEFRILDDGTKSMLVTEHAFDRVPKGCEIINMDKSFVIKEKGPNDPDFHDTRSKSLPTALMEKILPEGLSRYFMLDGEFLETFWKDSSTIKKGIEQISQLHLLSSLKEHSKPMTILPSIGSGDLSILSAEIQRLEWYLESRDESGRESLSEEPRWSNNENEKVVYYHVSGEPRIQDLEEDIEKMNGRIEDIFNEMPRSGPVESLNSERKTIEESMQSLERQVEDTRKVYTYNLITKSPYVFLKRHIEKCVEIVEERMNLGDLPVRQRRQFADDLLDKGTCVCGEDLGKESPDMLKRRERIKEFKENLSGKDDLDAAVDMRYNFRHEFIDKYDTYLTENFDNHRKTLSSMNTKYEALHKKHDEILAKLGNADMDKIDQMVKERKNLSDAIKSKQRLVDDEKSKIMRYRYDIRDKRAVLIKKSERDKRYRKVAYHAKIWDEIFNEISSIYEELKGDIRTNVQNQTWDRFRRLVAHPEQFKSFHIEHDYSVHLLDTHDTNQIRDLSAGQTLILTLAFTTTLREPTGYRFPLIIDSPLGKIDSPNKYNISTQISEYLPNEQLTLLVTDSEYVTNLTPDDDDPDIPTKPFGKLLSDTVALKHFRIKKERSKSNPNIGNSKILRADLVFDESRKTWVIETV